MDKINFYIPDFTKKMFFHIYFYELMKKFPQCFYENIHIQAVYGCFPGSIWNGGRAIHGSVSEEYIKNIIHEFNKRGIRIRYTFTNQLIEEKHLDDPFCNACMRLGDNADNEVVVNSPILEEYIRKNYPSYHIISSTTKCLEDIPDIQKELEKDYDLVVLDYSLNNSDLIFKLDQKNKVELLADSQCRDRCPNRRRHYQAVSIAQLEDKDVDFPDCPFINRNFEEIKQNQSFITSEDLYGKYVKAGFCNFKLDGRTMRSEKLLESYLYYFVKPEKQDVVRLTMREYMAYIDQH